MRVRHAPPRACRNRSNFDRRTPRYSLLLHWRYYNDPPEFFTVLLGGIDGLHWGYYLDDPTTHLSAGPQAGVASYYTNDAFELMTDGDTLFEPGKPSGQSDSTLAFVPANQAFGGLPREQPSTDPVRASVPRRDDTNPGSESGPVPDAPRFEKPTEASGGSPSVPER